MQVLPLLLFLTITVFTFGCASTSHESVMADKTLIKQCKADRKEMLESDNADQTLDQRIADFQLAMEAILTNRQQVLSNMNALSAQAESKSKQPISATDQQSLNRGLARGLEYVHELESTVLLNGCWYSDAKKPLTQADYKGSLLSLAAGLALYDSYLTVVSVLYENDRVRRYLNYGDKGYGLEEEKLHSMADAVLSRANIASMKKLIQFYHQYQSNFSEADTSLQYLVLLIEQSPAYQLVKSGQHGDPEAYRDYIRQIQMQDQFLAANRTIVNGISRLFGNATGLFESRKGKLYANPDLLADVESLLQPGDILLEKTPFRLTDKLIPGYWGHAAIWIGGEQALKELGIWEHPVVTRYHKQIQTDHLVVEALRDGVEMNPLAHFLNVDDLGVIRQRNMSDSERSSVIIETLRQVGKEYDFNYDIETTDKIVCSQLVYIAYPQFNWPTEKILGRYTISPDNIALQVRAGSELLLVEFFHDGKRVESEANEKMQQLMLMEAP